MNENGLVASLQTEQAHSFFPTEIPSSPLERTYSPLSNFSAELSTHMGKYPFPPSTRSLSQGSPIQVFGRITHHRFDMRKREFFLEETSENASSSLTNIFDHFSVLFNLRHEMKRDILLSPGRRVGVLGLWYRAGHTAFIQPHILYTDNEVILNKPEFLEAPPRIYHSGGYIELLHPHLPRF